MKVRRLAGWILSVTLAISVLLTACSDRGGGEAGSAGGSQSTGEEQVTLRFSFWGDTIEKKTITEALERFEQETGIQVEPMHVPADYLTKLTTMVAGNVAPDLGYLSSGAALSWGADGKLLNLAPLIDNDPEFKREDYLDQIWYEIAPDHIIGMSTAVEGYGLMYNKDLLLEAGVELPPVEAEQAWDWDTFVEYAKKLTLDDQGRNALDPEFNPDKIRQYGLQYDPYNMMAAVVSNGGNFLTEDGKEFGLAKPEAIEAIQKLADLMYVHHVSPTPLQTKNLPETALQTKKVAMTVSGNWALQAYGEQDINLGVGVLPKLKISNTLLDGAPTVIFQTTKHPEEAWLLYKYMADPESVLPLIAGGLWMPLKKEWYSNPELINQWAAGNKAHPDGYTEAFMVQTIENGIRTPGFEVKNLDKINALVTPALDLVWTGKRSAEEALKEVEVKVQPLIEGYYGR